MPFGRDSHCSEADLSAYLDARLAGAAKERCEAHLRACGRCSDAFESLSAVRSSLRALPQASAPRSFRLRQAQVDSAPARRPLLVQAMPLLSGLSAVSLVTFVALIGLNASGGADLGTSSDSKSTGSVMSADRETPADSSAPEFSDDAAGSGTVSPPSAATSATPNVPASPGGEDLSDRNSFVAQNPDEATRTAASAPEPAVLDASSDGGDSDTALHIAEAVAAAIALGSGGLAFAAYRRTR